MFAECVKSRMDPGQLAPTLVGRTSTPGACARHSMRSEPCLPTAIMVPGSIVAGSPLLERSPPPGLPGRPPPVRRASASMAPLQPYPRPARPQHPRRLRRMSPPGWSSIRKRLSPSCGMRSPTSHTPASCAARRAHYEPGPGTAPTRLCCWPNSWRLRRSRYATPLVHSTKRPLMHCSGHFPAPRTR